MDIQVLASSSRGNCYLVNGSGTPVLLECGLPFQAIRKGIGFGISGLAGCLISHEHADHARSVQELMRAGVDVYVSAGTIGALGISGHRLHAMQALQQVQIGPWTVLPFDTVHDAAEPLGFLVAGSGGKLLYLTDSAYCKYRFSGLTHIMIECNHSLDLLRQSVDRGEIPLAHKNRVLRNHMSLERVLGFLKANDLSLVEAIYLLHLSDTNADEAAFKATIQRATGKPVYVAQA